MVDNYLSKKIRFISFLSMILVVFLHSYNLGEEIIEKSSTEKGFVFFIQYFISQGIARIAVPIFFSISGYLFFLNKQTLFGGYILSLKKKTKSLVLPYLFWSIFGFLIFFLLQSLPQTTMFFKNKHIIDYSLHEIFDVIFIHPIPFQLWFIRDLFLFIFLSPLILFIIKYLKIFAVFFLLGLWLLNFDFIFFSTEAILFYIFGSSLGFYKLNLKKKNQPFTYLIILWIVLVFLEALFYTLNFNIYLILHTLHKFNILTGVFSIWFFYDLLYERTNVFKLGLFRYSMVSFFVYAFHEPLLEFTKIILFKFLGRSNYSVLFIYIISPMFVLSTCFLIGIFLKKYYPVFYTTITGGR